MAIEIKVENGKVMVESPYNPTFPANARKLGGKWTGGRWQFDVRDEKRVRALCLETFGDDGTPQQLVDVRLRLYRVSKRELWALGREVLARSGRDSAVKMGTGVVLIEGEFTPSGGSRQYPEIRANYNQDSDRAVIIEVRDVPRTLVENFEHEHLEIVEIIEHDDNSNFVETTIDLTNISNDVLVAALRSRGYEIYCENIRVE